ncbi:MAG: histidine triad nucleotide-binding protein [Chloroflexia bacterium]|nr:histidine triad nucleotide-binding protein [Chloroflexia bacterium]
MFERNHDCIFCTIAAGELGTVFRYESERVVAFDDVTPQAPTHVLVIPRTHLPDLTALAADHSGLATELIQAATQVAADKGIADTGFRVLVNVGEDAGQTVDHVHLHMLGGGTLARMG